MIENPLGKKTNYNSNYDKTLLFPIPRKINRDRSKIYNLAFTGFDIWNCYEFTYLNMAGIPVVYILQIEYDCHSENMVESKSLKLYLGSFSMTKFENIKIVIDIIKNDLKDVLKTEDIFINYYNSEKEIKYNKIENSLLIDNLEIEINEYNLNPNLLKKKENTTRETISRYSNLLKTNCPITGQPDYATVFIQYKSDFLITDDSLLKYIISYRGHGDYHENCCENIFRDIYNLINPEILVIKCFFTRRGGIDINPMRFYGVEEKIDFNFHYWRQ